VNLQWSETDVRPPSIAEWEELLIRLEIAPRALRIAVEEAPDTPALRGTLARLLAEEALRVRRIDAMTEGAPLPAAVDDASADAARGASQDTTAEALAVEFARVRARLFARAQRRGIDVWDWAGTLPDGTRLSAYQLLLGAMRGDAELLAAVRAAVREGAARC
jgi:hypothetical protein